MRSLSGWLLMACLATRCSALVTFDWVTVGAPGNAADPDANRGAVNRTYQISAYEVTNAQYAEFLNSAASIFDGRDLWNGNMGSDSRGGIARSGTLGNYSYSVKPNFANKPVTWVFFDGISRFINWIHNGQGAADTESGVYNMAQLQTSRSRASGAAVFLPTINEWYKAAYFDPRSTAQGGPSGNDNYWTFATKADTFPTPAVVDSTGNVLNPGSNVANLGDIARWNGVIGNVSTVGGAGLTSRSYWGTFDQTGNVREYLEVFTSGGAVAGGYFSTLPQSAQSFNTLDQGAAPLSDNIGFRVARDLTGDYNGDGMVDAADYTVWRDQLGTVYAPPDYNPWQIRFGTMPTPAAVSGSPVPEPSAILIGLLLACCAGLRIR
jgi:formylglycine-generating enzyme